MLDLLRKDELGELLYAHVTKFLVSDSVAEVLLKRLIALSSSLAVISTFIHEKDTLIEKENYNTDLAPTSPIKTVEKFSDGSTPVYSRSGSGVNKAW